MVGKVGVSFAVLCTYVRCIVLTTNTCMAAVVTQLINTFVSVKATVKILYLQVTPNSHLNLNTRLISYLVTTQMNRRQRNLPLDCKR